jgi:hypothetical protein
MADREKLKEAQAKRAKKYGISPVEGGHLTKPAEYEDVPESKFADPVNWKYPCDGDRALAAMQYFNHDGQREAGNYSESDWRVIGRRIAEMLDGDTYRYDPDSEKIIKREEAKGGPGSGNWGHAGRKGKRGGSAPRTSAMSLRTGATADLRQQIAKNPERDVAVIGKNKGGGTTFETPYNRDFVDDLKNNIAYSMRQWNPSKKRWVVAPEAADVARDIASQYFHVADGTKLNASQIKQVKQAVRTTRIKSTQKKLRQNVDRIESKIADLDEVISGYSYSSRSRRKADAIRRRAMFQYTLRDLSMKHEDMEDIQMRGMAKAAEELGL